MMPTIRFIAFLAALTFILVACFKQSSPLKAEFSVEQINPVTVLLNAENSGPSSDIVSYKWLFEDGQMGEGVLARHAFDRPGSYSVELILGHRNGSEKRLSKKVSLLKADSPQFLTDDKRDSQLKFENASAQALSWQLFVTQNPDNPQAGDWFDVSNRSGELGIGARQEVTLSLKQNLFSGTYRSSLTLEYAGTSQRFTVSALVGDHKTYSLITEPDYSTLPLIVSPDSGATFQVSVLRPVAFQEEVLFKLKGAPEGLTASLDPQSTRGNDSTVTLSVDRELASGDYELSIEGQAGSIVETIPVKLRVLNPQVKGDFSLSVSPATLRLAKGQSISTTVSINRTQFSPEVLLSAADLPQGLSAKFSQTRIANQAELTLTANESVLPGNYIMRVWGEAAGLLRPTELGVVISEKDAGDAVIRGTVQSANAGIPWLNQDSGQTNYLLPKQNSNMFVPGQLLVKYNIPDNLNTRNQQDKIPAQKQYKGELTQLLKSQYNFSVIRARAAGQADLVEFPEGVDILKMAETLEKDPRVAYAEPNYYLYTASLPDDPELSEQWHLAAAGLPVAWNLENGATSEVVVAVIDSGFDLNHSDLKSRIAGGYDFCAKSRCSDGASDSDPGYGNKSNIHGTHVAGIVGAIGDNGEGIAGVSYGEKLRLLLVKIFDDSGSTATISTFSDGIRWAIGLPVGNVPLNPNPAKIINMSLGAYFDSSSIQDVINEAQAKGVLLVAATGNDGRSEIMSPAAAEHVIGVGAVNSSYERSCFSNFGSNIENGPGVVDVVAPGGEGSRGCPNQGILSTFPEDDYGSLAGTSMAAPIVSGIAALLLSQEPGMSVETLEARLKKGSYFDDSYMISNEYGAGVLRADLTFGFPGPGAQVSIKASSLNDEATDAVTLDLKGYSNEFVLSGLQIGTYRIEATSKADNYQLKATGQVHLTQGETEYRRLELK